jgi:hypothetical protein
MKTLLTNIQTLLNAELSYIKDVAIVPDFLFFPEAPGFPLICLLDNGDEISGREKAARFERLKVSIGIYQAIASADESSVIGAGSEKGILDIKEDILDELRLVNFSDAYSYPKYIRSSKTMAVSNRDFESFAALKTIDLEYLKEVAEAT